MPPSMGPRMPMYSPGAPGMGQQLFYGQAPPAMIAPQVFFLLQVGLLMECYKCITDMKAKRV